LGVKLFLDDERTPEQVTWVELPLGPWIVVRSYDEFVRTIERDGLPTHISWDHDLGLEHYQAYEKAVGELVPAPLPYDSFREKTGYHCARWLVDYCMEHGWLALPEYTIHSMNVIGEANIEALFRAYERNREGYREARS
jgi:hypothetical protein